METDTDERNEKAKREYSAVLTVTSPAPEKKEYLDFSDQVRFKRIPSVTEICLGCGCI